MFFAPPLAEVALKFGPPEYFSLTLVGLIFLSRLGGGSAIKSFLMVGFGLLLGTVGMEPISGLPRFTFGQLQLSQGVELVPVVMGFILLLCLVGTYSVNNSFLDIYLFIGMGVVGYILKKLKFDLAPVILALVLGPMLEKTLRQSLFMALGDVWTLVSRPITAVLLSAGLAVIILPPFLRAWQAMRQKGKATIEP